MPLEDKRSSDSAWGAAPESLSVQCDHNVDAITNSPLPMRQCTFLVAAS